MDLQFKAPGPRATAQGRTKVPAVWGSKMLVANIHVWDIQEGVWYVFA